MARRSGCCWTACGSCAHFSRKAVWSVNRSPDSLPTSAFDYELPARLIARHPAEQRDDSRLLVLRRDTGGLEHKHFRDLPGLMAAGDALVLNETRVLPARLLGRRPSGGQSEILLLQPADGVSYDGTDWVAMVRPGAKLKAGVIVEIAPELHVQILETCDDGTRMVRLVTALPVASALQRHGRMPLPP